jgi:hypothetical protein
MPRSARRFRPGSIQYVFSRIVSYQRLSSDDERRRYLELFGQAMEATDWKCVGYCISNSEFHFAMVAGTQPLDSWSKRVNGTFAQWLNRQRNGNGPVFSGRPISREVPRECFMELIAFIHNNPVRRRVPADSASEWSSHRKFLGREKAPLWLHTDEGLRMAGFGGRPEAFDRAVRLLAHRRSLSLPEVVLDHGGARRIEPDMQPMIVIEAAARAVGVSTSRLQRHRVRGPAADAKRIAVHAARAIGIPLARMASALFVSRQRASRIAATDLAPHLREILAKVVEAVGADISVSVARAS